MNKAKASIVGTLIVCVMMIGLVFGGCSSSDTGIDVDSTSSATVESEN